jgi:NAD(P)-dependent dehydrogenase (short-subunit alcohol dehydrogenase family)
MISPYPLAGKLALITGASKGIGAATALELASLGAKVVINYSSDAALADELVKKIGSDKAIAIKANAADVGEMARLVEETVNWSQGGGKIDILVPNAGLALMRTLEQTTEEEWQKTMNLNVKGPYFLAQVCSSVVISVHQMLDNQVLTKPESNTPHAPRLARHPPLDIPLQQLDHHAQLPTLRDLQGRD